MDVVGEGGGKVMLREPDHKGPGFRFYSVVLIYLMRGIIRYV